jgi:hypothetical protein
MESMQCKQRGEKRIKRRSRSEASVIFSLLLSPAAGVRCRRCAEEGLFQKENDVTYISFLLLSSWVDEPRWGMAWVGSHPILCPLTDTVSRVALTPMVWCVHLGGRTDGQCCKQVSILAALLDGNGGRWRLIAYQARKQAKLHFCPGLVSAKWGTERCNQWCGSRMLVTIDSIHPDRNIVFHCLCLGQLS